MTVDLYPEKINTMTININPTSTTSESTRPPVGGPSPASTGLPAEAGFIFHWYLCGAIVINLLLLFFDAHGGDQGYWQDWVRQLGTKGYGQFDGNYPPLYIHWLWMTAKLHDLLSLSYDISFFLKFVAQIPVLMAHLLLIAIVYQILKRYAASPAHFHMAMTLATFNPALLLDGPVWGQIDVIPVVPAVAAILISCHARWRIFTFPLYCLALLFKFQMIAFAPLMGLIFLRHWKIHLVGGLLGLLLIPLAFLPSIVTGNFIRAFELAYIEVVSQYGRATMNAANIWILLTGNMAPDSRLLFGIPAESPLAPFFTARRFGMGLFVVVMLALFFHSLWLLVRRRLPETGPGAASQLLLYAVIYATAFFTLLPSMHERYLIPAAIVAIAYYAVSPSRLAFPVALTFVSAFNLLMTLGVKTSYVWPGIAWLTLFILLAFLLDTLLPIRIKNPLYRALGKLVRIPLLSLWVLILSLATVGQMLYHTNYIHRVKLTEHQQLLTDITPRYHKQGYGKLEINKSVSGNSLRLAGKRYASGFGTHVNSVIEFDLPHNSEKLSFLAGVDDAVESTEVRFQVQGDGRVLWQSPIHYGSEKNLQPVELDITGVARLSLRAYAIKSINSGHVNWVSPVITHKLPDSTAE